MAWFSCPVVVFPDWKNWSRACWVVEVVLRFRGTAVGPGAAGLTMPREESPGLGREEEAEGVVLLDPSDLELSQLGTNLEGVLVGVGAGVDFGGSVYLAPGLFLERSERGVVWTVGGG